MALSTNLLSWYVLSKHPAPRRKRRWEADKCGSAGMKLFKLYPNDISSLAAEGKPTTEEGVFDNAPSTFCLQNDGPKISLGSSPLRYIQDG